MSQCFTKPFSRFGGNVKIKRNKINMKLRNKIECKKSTGANTSSFAKKDDLFSLNQMQIT